MTCRLIAGFDELPTAGTDTERLMSAGGWYWYTGFDIFPIITTGRFGYGGCVGFNQGNTNRAPNFYRLLGVSVASGIMGFAFKWHPSNTNIWVTFYDAVSGLPNFSVSFHPLGVIKVWKGFPPPGTGTLLITSNPGVFTQEQWFYCEIKGTVDSTSGSVQVRVNTQVVIDLLSSNTNGGGRSIVDSIGFGVLSGGAFQYYIDDLYFNDTAGSVNNDYLGNVRVKTQFAASAGDSTQFSIGGTVPAPTNWQSVLNTALDDTKFVYDQTVGHEDLYHVQAIINAPLVHAIQVSQASRMDDSTQRVARNAIKSGSTVATGADHYINQTYTMYRDIFELNPDTGVSFTGTEANAIQIGPKVEA